MAGETYIYPADVTYDMIPKSDYEKEQDRQKKLAKQAKAAAEAEMKVNDYDNSLHGEREQDNWLDGILTEGDVLNADNVIGYPDEDEKPEDSYDVFALLGSMTPTERENFLSAGRRLNGEIKKEQEAEQAEDAAYLDYMANKDLYRGWEKPDPNATVVEPLDTKTQKFFENIDDLVLGYDPRERRPGYEPNEDEEPSALEEMSYFMPIIGDKVYAGRAVSDMANGRRVPGALDWLSILGTGVGIGSGIYAGKKFLNGLRARRYMKLPETLKLKGTKIYENVPVFNANGTMSDASFYDDWYNTLERFKPRKKYSDTYNGQPIVGDFDQYGVPVR